MEILVDVMHVNKIPFLLGLLKDSYHRFIVAKITSDV